LLTINLGYLQKKAMSRARHSLSDEQYERIKNLLPGKASDSGVTAKNNRLFVDGVLFVLKTGIQWRDLPERFGKWDTVYQRFNRWTKRGRWSAIFAELQEIDLEELQLDSTIIRAHQHAAGQKKVVPKKNRSVARVGE